MQKRHHPLRLYALPAQWAIEVISGETARGYGGNPAHAYSRIAKLQDTSANASGRVLDNGTRAPRHDEAADLVSVPDLRINSTQYHAQEEMARKIRNC